MSKRIMVRSAEDDFTALRTMNAMESAGAEVFALTPYGTAIHLGALQAHQRFQVWAKVASDAVIDAIDAAIDKEFSD
jgi:hypothetical protein